MNSRPWEQVAVYVRAPAADAPMAAESAPNSDSTIRYSHGSSSPVRTRSERCSTMWVWGEIGYALITSGRQSATDWAIAREPSSCLSTGHLPDLMLNDFEGGIGRQHVALCDLTGELLG